MAARRGPPGLGRDRVVAAALEELDGSGLDHLTMRGVAARLGVRLNTVYWHARSKPELIDLMADALLEGAAREPLPAPWTDRLRVLATRYRDALLARRDGARVVHLAGGSHPHTDAFTEALLETLAAAGLDERGAGWAARTVLDVVAGVAADPGAGRDPGEAAPPERERFPRGHRAAAHRADDDLGDRFAFVLDLLVDGLDARAAATRPVVEDDLVRRLRPPPPAARRPRRDR